MLNARLGANAQSRHPCIKSRKRALRLGVCLKATPHKDRASRFAACLPLMRGIRAALWANRANVLFAPTCLHLFRHLAQILLEIRQYSCVGFVQSDEKSAGAIGQQSLCGIALRHRVFRRIFRTDIHEKQGEKACHRSPFH